MNKKLLRDNEVLNSKALEIAMGQVSTKLINLQADHIWPDAVSGTKLGSLLSEAVVSRPLGAGVQFNSASPLGDASGGLDRPFQANSVLDSFVVSPLIKGILSLFRGGRSEAPLTPVKYSYPLENSISVEARQRPDGSSEGVSMDGYGLSKRGSNSTQSITINVQALDSRSLIDRSDDIASALRQAILSNSSINDSIGEI